MAKKLETIRVGLYGNFMKGKHLSKFFDIISIEDEAKTKKEFMLYTGIGGISKLHNIGGGHQILIQPAVVTVKSLEDVLRRFDNKLIDIDLSNGETIKSFAKPNSDLDLTLIRNGIINGK